MSTMLDYSFTSPESIRLPDILYKYRSWRNVNHRDILLKNQVFFASPSSFEDEFDCNPPEENPSIDFLKEHYYKASCDKHPHYDKKQHELEALCDLEHCPILNKDERKRLINRLHAEYCDRFGVLSLTANPKIPDMWEKYADDHKGFCVGFNSKLISTVAGGGGPIIYTEKLPSVILIQDDMMTEHIKRVYHKLIEWSFEDEYRLHKMWNHSVSDEERNLSLPPNSIMCVIAGRMMSDTDFSQLSILMKQYHPEAKVIREE